jgi:hypothetical protein
MTSSPIARVSTASLYTDAPSWRQGIRAALESLLALMQEQRTLARLCVVEALRGGERVRDRRMRTLDELAKVVDEGRRAMNASSQPPDSAAEGVVGGVVAMLQRRLEA